MVTALFIIDVQNDFTEGGALGVEGGAAVAAGVTLLLAGHPERYGAVFASRDWHDGDNDNGGHFAAIDVVGIATDYCVLASALDARESGRSVRVLTDLVAGVAPESSTAALSRLAAAGVATVASEKVPTEKLLPKQWHPRPCDPRRPRLRQGRPRERNDNGN